MKTPCCVESGNICPKSSSCSMILRSSCSHRHSHKSLMVSEVQTQGDTHKKRNYHKKISNSKVLDTDSVKNSKELDSLSGSSDVKHIALTSTENFSILKENLFKCLELSEKKDCDFIEKNGHDSLLVGKLYFTNTSTPYHLHLNDFNNGEDYSQKSTIVKEDSNLITSSTMSRTRRLQRSNLRALSESETEDSSFLENRVKLKKTRKAEAISRLNSTSNSHIAPSKSSASTYGSSNHITTTQSYSTSSAIGTGASAVSYTNYPYNNTPTSAFIQNQRAVSPDSPQIDISVVQYSAFDRFRWMIWRYVYLKIITSVNFDAWLLSRLHDKKFKVVMILLLPLLIYLFYSMLYRDMGILSKPYDLISSTIFSFVSFIYSLLSSPFIHSQEILEGSSSFSCPDISSLPVISGLFSSLSNFFVKTDESTTFISKKRFEPPDVISQSMKERQSPEEFRSAAVELLDERFNKLINNFYVTRIQYDNLKAKEETTSKFQKEISDLNLQFQSLSVLLKQLEKDVHKIETSSAKSVANNFEYLSTEHDAHFKLLNEKLKAFEVKLESLGAVKRCCDEKMSPSDFMATLEKHLITAFKNVIEGDRNSNSPYYFFNEWLNSKLADHTKLSSEIKAAFENLKMQLKHEARQDKDSMKVIESIVQHYIESLKMNLSSSGSSVKDFISVHDMRKIAKEAIMLYDADKTGLVDYALESAGGSILGTRCSESYVEKNGKFSLFGLPLWSDQNSPRTAIQPNVQPGFTLEHIPVSLSPTGAIDSAPKEFSVWGLATETDNEGTILGKYVYDQNGEPLQYFPVTNVTAKPFSFIELKIHSNQGNLEFTCLYRFRVHGTRVK